MWRDELSWVFGWRPPQKPNCAKPCPEDGQPSAPASLSQRGNKPSRDVPAQSLVHLLLTKSLFPTCQNPKWGVSGGDHPTGFSQGSGSPPRSPCRRNCAVGFGVSLAKNDSILLWFKTLLLVWGPTYLSMGKSKQMIKTRQSAKHTVCNIEQTWERAVIHK